MRLLSVCICLLLLSSAVQHGESADSAGGCKEPSWCKTAPSTKPLANGEENPGCKRWTKDCVCTCAKTRLEVLERENAAKREEEAEKAAITARDSALRDHIQTASASGVHSDLQVSILVRSQNVPSDAGRIEHFRSLAEQYEGTVEFLFLSELENQVRPSARQSPAGFWAATPFLYHWLETETKLDNAEWFVIIEPWTDVNVPALQALLGYFDSSEQHFLGRGLDMRRGVLTLHHEFPDLTFGWPDAGLVMSRSLVRGVVEGLAGKMSQNFFVTWEREFAHNVRATTGVQLTSLGSHFCDSHDPSFRTSGGNSARLFCATVALSKYPLRASFGLSYDDIIIAVKTTLSYHAERLDILRNTWAKNTSHPVEIIFASDGEDPEYNSIDLTQEWGPQVDQKKGHCAKAYAIMQHLLKYFPDKKVFVIADDDSMMHVPNLLKMVDAYDWEDTLYLGQRYGFGFNDRVASSGYSYITMGGGLCLSKSFMQRIVEDHDMFCSAPDTPDDMQFGRWARRLGVPAIHDDGFHQAQLENYNQDTVLRSQRVVSYHKFEKVLNHETKEWRVETAANVAEYFRRFPDLRHVSGGGGNSQLHDASEL